MNSSSPLYAQLCKLRKSRLLILGIGNELKGDDAAGPLVCEKINGKVKADVINAGTAPENYIGSIIKKAPENILIIDALDFAAAPGSTEIFRPQQLSVFTTSTHTPSLCLFSDVINSEVDANVYVIGIQPACTDLGKEVSEEINKAVSTLAELLIELFSVDKTVS